MMFKTKEVVEFVSDKGITYIGKFNKVEGDIVTFSDVLCITLVSVPNPNGEGSMWVPKFDILNYFSKGNDWNFNVNDIVYSSSDIGPNFVNIYDAYIEQFDISKQRGGSPIDVVKDIPSDLKNIKVNG